MATREDFFVALLLGIGPALAILWTSLRRFDRPRVEHTLFDDRRVFGGPAAPLPPPPPASGPCVARPRDRRDVPVRRRVQTRLPHPPRVPRPIRRDLLWRVARGGRRLDGRRPGGRGDRPGR